MFEVIGTIIIGILTAFFYGKFSGVKNAENKQNKHTLQNITKAKKIEQNNAYLNNDELNEQLQKYVRDE